MANRIFPKKYSKKINEAVPEFLDNVIGLDSDKIKEKILECEGNIYETEIALDGDEELVKIREKVKEIAAPYKDAKAVEMAKLKYCVFVLDERGIKL